MPFNPEELYLNFPHEVKHMRIRIHYKDDIYGFYIKVCDKEVLECSPEYSNESQSYDLLEEEYNQCLALIQQHLNNDDL